MKLPLRILVLCTANSARGQITQALFRYRGGDRVFSESAGITPAERVHPGASEVLEAHGISTAEHRPSEALKAELDRIGEEHPRD